MPHKIGFTVVSSSGHEDGFSARELMVHAPTVNGWRSPRLCQYPQEITLQLVERCRIRKLQLLAHQYMIASKIEFYISESLPEYFAPYQSERFQRLGYVPLSDNEKTDFRARELKSVYMDAVGQYLKLIFHKNYVNKYNLYGQVALVAVNIIGDPADYGIGSMNSPSREKLIDHYLGIKLDDPALDGTYLGKHDSISPLDDLAFDMYQDPEVAQIIRRLDEKKREAVHLECYDHAKKLKQAIADLQKVGERLGRYEVEKRYAVEKEDYDLAKKKKEQMDEYRLKVYQQLELHDLLDAQLLIQKPPELPLGSVSGTESPQSCPPEPADPPQGEPLRAEPVLEEHLVDPTSSEPVVPYQSPLSPRTQPTTSKEVFSKENVEILPYDERPLPTMCKQVDEAVAYVEPEVAEEDVGDTPRTGNAGEPEQLTQKALREASPVVEVFGETLVLGAYSRTWSCREDALLTVYKKLMEVSVDTPKEDLRNVLRAAVFLVRRAIKDTVSSVFQASLKLLKMIITQYIPKHKLGKLETSHCVETTLPHLLSRTGDSSSRLRLLASTFIQEMALCPEVKPLQIIPVHLVKTLKPNSPTHLAMSRVELVESLLGAMGTENSGFTVNNVMKFATGALEHRAYEVREVVLRIIFAMYREHRAAVLEYFPLDDAGARRTVRYKTLFEGFAKIDGKSSESEVRAQRKAATEAEKQTKEEMKVLKGHPAALKLELQAEVEAEEEKESYFQKTENQGYQVYEATAAEIQEELSSVANYLDNLCIFCGERNESFTEEGLDLHYWKHCPMLTRCEHCKQMLEICSLTEHLLTDCDKRGSFGRCPRCREAVPRDELPRHIKSRICNPAKPENVANHCPLCHENFPPGEEAWRSHLMNRDGCKMNQRRTSLLNKTILVQPAKVVGHYLRRPGPSGAKFQSPSIGSKIRTRGGSNKNTGKTYSKR
ncbi:centrosomal protein of 104 kDa isoform X1 [Onychostruthus taczanowskii]|uniref:centrosomal protein of 104 kDa isoform X1 n=1 Tax=Onychostruthus taczanowskii TaxID=356909 RepID=UPI001B7FF0BB|nr:centrosomal protein of 104 kDa isoform X1 [Onychostruthus taczanowskii]